MNIFNKLFFTIVPFLLILCAIAKMDLVKTERGKFIGGLAAVILVILATIFFILGIWF